MQPLKTEVQIEVIESNGKKQSGYMSIVGPADRGGIVELVFNNQKVTVVAWDLMDAIQSCRYC